MEVFTTEPGLQVYTDNGANGYKGNMEQLSHVVVLSVLKHNTFLIVLIALTSLLFILEPCREYKQKTIYKFGVEEIKSKI